MAWVVTATFENGVLKPEQKLELAPGARVRLIVESLHGPAEDREKAWQEFDQLCEEISVDSGSEKMTRDQLHERD